MVADELAVTLARKYVRPGDRVLDPFCGSGRLLLAAAGNPGDFVGIDVNPLAYLITMAKSVAASLTCISQILSDIGRTHIRVPAATLDLRERRKVQWYSDAVLTELSQIVSWINSLKLGRPEKTVMAAALSAAVRDASYCRKSGWKLHRLGAVARQAHSTSAWDCLVRRLRYYMADAAASAPVRGRVSVICGDAKDLLAPGSPDRLHGLFDLVITSPPYGDSITTVQYGAASSLCLDVVSHIEGLETLFVPGREIDQHCLGGRLACSTRPDVIGDIKRYWAGSRTSKRAPAVSAFLFDFAQVCVDIASSIKPGGCAVLVLGQRSVGGFRLKLNAFAVDRLERQGLSLTSHRRRRLNEKWVPRTINRYGRAGSDDLRIRGTTKTMNEEYILTFVRSVKELMSPVVANEGNRIAREKSWAREEISEIGDVPQYPLSVVS